MGARPGEPDRRAHRLQRRVRAAAGAGAGRGRGRPRRRRARAAGALGCSRTRRSRCRWPDRPRRRGRLGGLRRGCRLGAAGGRATRCRGWTWSSTGTSPSGAGLSSSAALECAVAVAWNDLAGLELSPRRARRGRPARGERRRRRPDRRHGPDGVAARPGRAPGLPRHAVARRRARAVRPAVGRPGPARDRHSKAPHALVDGEYAERRRSCEQAAAILGVPALRDVAVGRPRRRAGSADGRRSCCAGGCATSSPRTRGCWRSSTRCGPGDDPRTIGPALTASHASMRDDFEITVPEVDTAVDGGAGRGRARRADDRRRVRRLRARAGRTDAVDAVVRAVEAAYADGGLPAAVGLRGDGRATAPAASEPRRCTPHGAGAPV